MKTSSVCKCVSVICLGVSAFVHAGDQLYRVSESGDEGVDLLALDDSYRKDGFEFYSEGSTLSVTGAITHAAIPDGGWFDIIGAGSSGSRINLWNTGLFTDGVLNTPVRLGGTGRVNFYDDTLELGADWSRWISWDETAKAYLWLKRLNVRDTSGTPFTFSPGGPITVSYAKSGSPAVRLGQDGSRLTALFNHVINCGTHWSDAEHNNYSMTMYIGGRSSINTTAGYADVTLNAAVNHDLGMISFSPIVGLTDSCQSQGLTNILTLACGTVSVLHVTRYGTETSILRFAKEGAILRQYGNWAELFRLSGTHKDGTALVLESQDGVTIRLVLRESCKAGTGTYLETRGTGDVYFGIGGKAGSANTLKLDSFTWNSTGDVILAPWGEDAYFVHLQGTDAFPHGEGFGDVVIEEGVTALLTQDQSFNSVTGAGSVLNRAADPVTFTVGCDGGDCTYELTSPESATVGGTAYANAGWNVLKTGVGDLTLKAAPPGRLDVEGGDVIVPVSLTLEPASVGLAAGSALRVTDGAVFDLSSDVFAADTSSRKISLESSAVLVVGGDGADEVLDLADVSGDVTTVIRKVGSNKVTLLNHDSFKGMVVREEGVVVPSVADALTWTGGAGSDTSFSALANWGLTEDTLLRGFTATFGAGGDTATLTDDTPLSGIVFNQTADGKNGFTVSGTSTLVLGDGGVSAVLPGAGLKRDYVITAPLEIQSSQTWAVADGGDSGKNTLTIAGPLSSSLDGLTVTKTGAGEFNLCATGSVSDATIDVKDACTVRISGDNAWGASGSLLKIGSGSPVEFGGGTFEGDLRTALGTSKKITTVDGSTNVFTGAVSLDGAHTWTIGANSLMEFHGPFTCGGWSTGRGSDLSTSTMRFYDTCTISSGEWINFTLDYRAPNNSLGSTFVLRYGISRHLLNCDWAWNTDATCQVWLGSVIDICGHDNRVGTFQLKSAGIVTNSGEKATFWTKTQHSELTESDSSGVKYPIYIRGDLRGPVTLGKTGPCDLTITNRAVSSSGDVVVAAGRLAFCPASSWLNASEVTVTNALPDSGAVLEIRNPKTFGKTVDVRLGNGGKLRLGVSGADPLIRQTVRHFYIDGVLQPKGVYSADKGDGTPVVPGTVPCSLLEGPGVLRSVGDGYGTRIVIF